MGNSLREQLLKGGLASKKQAKAAVAESRKKATAKRKAQKSGIKVDDVDEATLKAENEKAKRVEQDRELNRKHEEERAQKELIAQIRDLVNNNEIKPKGGDIAHNFLHGANIRSIQVNEELHREIIDGHLGIVFLDDKYSLVPCDVAEKIITRLPESIVLLNTRVNEEGELDEDDPYSEYAIPDDLMW